MWSQVFRGFNLKPNLIWGGGCPLNRKSTVILQDVTQENLTRSLESSHIPKYMVMFVWPERDLTGNPGVDEGSRGATWQLFLELLSVDIAFAWQSNQSRILNFTLTLSHLNIFESSYNRSHKALQIKGKAAVFCLLILTGWAAFRTFVADSMQ